MICMEFLLYTRDSDEVSHDLHFQDKPSAICKQKLFQSVPSTHVNRLVDGRYPEVHPCLKLSMQSASFIRSNPSQVVPIRGLDHSRTHVFEYLNPNLVGPIFESLRALLCNVESNHLTNP